MQLTLPVLVVTLAALAFGAIKEIRPVSNRPGRFLSLPVPNKCSARKFPEINRIQVKPKNLNLHDYWLSHDT